MGPFELVKKELENCVIQKGKEAIFRLMAKWTEEGEKCSQYFLSSEKHNFEYKCITKIKFEGNCISYQDNILREIKH